MLGALAVSLFLSWVQVSSETYIVKSSAGEDRAKRVLRELEHFHQLVGTLVFRYTELPELGIFRDFRGSGRYDLAGRSILRSDAATQDGITHPA